VEVESQAEVEVERNGGERKSNCRMQISEVKMADRPFESREARSEW